MYKVASSFAGGMYAGIRAAGLGINTADTAHCAAGAMMMSRAHLCRTRDDVHKVFSANMFTRFER